MSCPDALMKLTKGRIQARVTNMPYNPSRKITESALNLTEEHSSMSVSSNDELDQGTT